MASYFFLLNLLLLGVMSYFVTRDSEPNSQWTQGTKAYILKLLKYTFGVINYNFTCHLLLDSAGDAFESIESLRVAALSTVKVLFCHR